MAVTNSGWLDWATRYNKPVPIWKQNGGRNSASVYIPHSAVGYFGGFEGRLIFSDDRAAVHGWIGYDGKVIQMYPFTSQCWSSGSAYPNNNGIAFENEGGFRPENEPLTVAQIAANVRIIEDIGGYINMPNSYWRRPNGFNDLTATLYEHRECNRFGSSPTACPSSRIPWNAILNQLAKPEQEKDELMIPHIGVAEWFDDRWLADSEGSLWTMTATRDVGLGERQTELTLAVYINQGKIIFHHSHDAAYLEAGRAGERGVNYQVIKVRTDERGDIKFQVQGETQIGRIHSLGYTA